MKPDDASALAATDELASVLSPAQEKFLAQFDEVPNRRSASFVEEPVVEKWSQGFRFHGLAAVYGQPTDLGMWTEEMERGVFRKYQANGASIPFLTEHNSGRMPLATTHADTLRLEDVPQGIQVDADIADTTDGRDLYTLTKRGDVRGMSLGMVVGRGNSKIELRAGKPHRLIRGFKKILDVSATWDPAYPGTAAEFRSSAEFRSAVLAFAGEPDVLQHLLEGDLPQLEDLGNTDMEEAPETRTGGRDDPDAGAIKSIAARRRELQFLVLTTGGINDATG